MSRLAVQLESLGLDGITAQELADWVEAEGLVDASLQATASWLRQRTPEIDALIRDARLGWWLETEIPSAYKRILDCKTDDTDSVGARLVKQPVEVWDARAEQFVAQKAAASALAFESLRRAWAEAWADWPDAPLNPDVPPELPAFSTIKALTDFYQFFRPSHSDPAHPVGTIRLFLDMLAEEARKGGPGSGHFGHEGRPGQRGGSQPGDGFGGNEAIVFSDERAAAPRGSGWFRPDPDGVKMGNWYQFAKTNYGTAEISGRIADYQAAGISDPGVFHDALVDSPLSNQTRIQLNVAPALRQNPLGVAAVGIEMAFYSAPTDGQSVFGTHVVGVLQMTFGNNKRAFFDNMLLDGIDQQSGLGEKALRYMADVCDRLGIEQIGLYADITIGRYAWAKYGFDFEDIEGLDYANDRFRKFVVDRGLMTDDEVPTFESAYEIATFSIPGVTVSGGEIGNMAVDPSAELAVGKAFLLADAYDAGGLKDWRATIKVKTLRSLLDEIDRRKAQKALAFIKGGPGSGYHNEPGNPHRGRPGERGGSLPSDAGPNDTIVFGDESAAPESNGERSSQSLPAAGRSLSPGRTATGMYNVVGIAETIPSERRAVLDKYIAKLAEFDEENTSLSLAERVAGLRNYVDQNLNTFDFSYDEVIYVARTGGRFGLGWINADIERAAEQSPAAEIAAIGKWGDKLVASARQHGIARLDELIRPAASLWFDGRSRLGQVLADAALKMETSAGLRWGLRNYLQFLPDQSNTDAVNRLIGEYGQKTVEWMRAQPTLSLAQINGDWERISLATIISNVAFDADTDLMLTRPEQWTLADAYRVTHTYEAQAAEWPDEWPEEWAVRGDDIMAVAAAAGGGPLRTMDSAVIDNLSAATLADPFALDAFRGSLVDIHPETLIMALGQRAVRDGYSSYEGAEDAALAALRWINGEGMAAAFPGLYARSTWNRMSVPSFQSVDQAREFFREMHKAGYQSDQLRDRVLFSMANRGIFANADEVVQFANDTLRPYDPTFQPVVRHDAFLTGLERAPVGNATVDSLMEAMYLAGDMPPEAAPLFLGFVSPVWGHAGEREAEIRAKHPRLARAIQEMEIMPYDPQVEQPDARSRESGLDGKVGMSGRFERELSRGIKPDLDAYEQRKREDANRGRVKDKIVKALSTSAGVSYDEADDFVEQWATTSNSTLLPSLGIQEMAAEEFGVPLSEWQQKRLTDALAVRARETQDEGSAKWHNQYLFEPDRGETEAKTMTRALLKKTYARTQRYLKREGITHILLYRGVKEKTILSQGDVTTYDDNVLSSWSTDIDTARGFASGGMVLSAVVPAERIYSTALTGQGCLSEYEVIVLGNPDRGRARVVVGRPATAALEELLAPSNDSDRRDVIPSLKGGPGSGHFDHAGRPGQRGGSLPGDGVESDDAIVFRDESAAASSDVAPAKPQFPTSFTMDDGRTITLPAYRTAAEVPYALSDSQREEIRRNLRKAEVNLYKFMYKDGTALDRLVADFNTAASNVTRIAHEYPLAMRVTFDDLGAILETGRFKTQFETGDSNGRLDLARRSATELALFGVPQTIEPYLRPVYAYVDFAEPFVEQYGELKIVLKEEVKHRSTVVLGDSFISDGAGVWIDDLNENAHEVVGGWLNEGRDLPVNAPNDEWAGWKFNQTAYVEAQVHGGLTLNDIDHVVVYHQKPTFDRWQNSITGEWEAELAVGVRSRESNLADATAMLEANGLTVRHKITIEDGLDIDWWEGAFDLENADYWENDEWRDEGEPYKGGPGSGHFDHAGRPGLRGGSKPSNLIANDDSESLPDLDLDIDLEKDWVDTAPVLPASAPVDGEWGGDEDRAFYEERDRNLAPLLRLLNIDDPRDMTYALQQYAGEWQDVRDALESTGYGSGIPTMGNDYEVQRTNALIDASNLLSGNIPDVIYGTGTFDVALARMDAFGFSFSELPARVREPYASNFVELVDAASGQPVPEPPFAKLSGVIGDRDEYAKAERVARRAGLDNRDAVGVFKLWAAGSNDSAEAAALQEEVGKLFGITPSAWQADWFAEWGNEVPDSYRETLSRTAQAIYDETQDVFQKAGVTHVRLYRGVQVGDGYFDKEVHAGSVVSYDDNILSSWTWSKEIATQFAMTDANKVSTFVNRAGENEDPTGVVLSAVFPVERIFSLAETGLGTYTESEAVILGSGDARAFAAVTRRITDEDLTTDGEDFDSFYDASAEPMAGSRAPVDASTLLPTRQNYRDVDLDQFGPETTPVQFAAQIRDLDGEVGGIWDRNGRMVTTLRGENRQIEIESRYVRSMSGGVFVHNHPTNSTFSSADIVGSIQARVAEVQAVGLNGTHRMTFDTAAIPNDDRRGELLRMAADTKRRSAILAGFVEKVRTGELTAQAALDAYGLADWQDFAERANDLLGMEAIHYEYVPHAGKAGQPMGWFDEYRYLSQRTEIEELPELAERRRGQIERTARAFWEKPPAVATAVLFDVDGAEMLRTPVHLGDAESRRTFIGNVEESPFASSIALYLPDGGHLDGDLAPLLFDGKLHELAVITPEAAQVLVGDASTIDRSKAEIDYQTVQAWSRRVLEAAGDVQRRTIAYRSGGAPAQTPDEARARLSESWESAWQYATDPDVLSRLAADEAVWPPTDRVPVDVPRMSYYTFHRNPNLPMKGGKGSGHRGHRGRPGQRGGSLPSERGNESSGGGTRWYGWWTRKTDRSALSWVRTGSYAGLTADAFIKEIASFDSEWGAIVGDDGRVETLYEGSDRTTINLPLDVDFRGKRFIHNHPCGSNLSDADVRTALHMGMRSISAVSPSGEFRLTIDVGAEGYWAKKDALVAMAGRYNKAENFLTNQYHGDVLSGGMTVAQANREVELRCWDQWRSMLSDDERADVDRFMRFEFVPAMGNLSGLPDVRPDYKGTLSDSDTAFRFRQTRMEAARKLVDEWRSTDQEQPQAALIDPDGTVAVTGTGTTTTLREALKGRTWPATIVIFEPDQVDGPEPSYLNADHVDLLYETQAAEIVLATPTGVEALRAKGYLADTYYYFGSTLYDKQRKKMLSKIEAAIGRFPLPHDASPRDVWQNRRDLYAIVWSAFPADFEYSRYDESGKLVATPSGADVLKKAG